MPSPPEQLPFPPTHPAEGNLAFPIDPDEVWMGAESGMSIKFVAANQSEGTLEAEWLGDTINGVEIGSMELDGGYLGTDMGDGITRFFFALSGLVKYYNEGLGRTNYCLITVNGYSIPLGGPGNPISRTLMITRAFSEDLQENDGQGNPQCGGFTGLNNEAFHFVS